MRVLDPSHARAARHALGVSDARGHGCYHPELEKSCQAIVAIREVTRAEAGALFHALLAELLKMRAVWWLVPLHKYFGDTWSEDGWASVGLPPLTDHVLELSISDCPAIETIVTSHYQQGCTLYLASADGELLFRYIPLGVAARRRGVAEALSIQL